MISARIRRHHLSTFGNPRVNAFALKLSATFVLLVVADLGSDWGKGKETVSLCDGAIKGSCIRTAGVFTLSLWTSARSSSLREHVRRSPKSPKIYDVSGKFMLGDFGPSLSSG